MTDMNQKMKTLQSPFRANEVQWRKGRVNADNSKAQALPCITVRSVQERLDEALGCGNWANRYVEVVANGQLLAVRCALSVNVDGVWVEKEDACPVEPKESLTVNDIKTAYSDALKRAAVQWGVGRYLYKYPPVWAELDQHGRFLQTPQLPKAFLPPEDHVQQPAKVVHEEPPTERHAELVDSVMEHRVSAKHAPEPAKEPDHVGAVLQGGEAPAQIAERVPADVPAPTSTPALQESAPAAPAPESTSSTERQESGVLTYEELITEVSAEQKTLIDDLLAKLEKMPAKMIISYVTGPKGMEKLSEPSRQFILSKANAKDKKVA